MVHFAVITKIPDDNEGNYACAEALINPRGNQHVVGSKILVSQKFDGSLFTDTLPRLKHVGVCQMMFLIIRASAAKRSM